MKIYVAFFITIFFSLYCTAQKLEVNVSYVTSDPTVKKPVIYYLPSNKLTWDNFKGKPDKNSEASAVTNAGIGLKMAFSANENVSTLNLEVGCHFSIMDSWVKSGKKTDYILNHEQHHFDIVYLFAMQFIHDLKTTKFTKSNYIKLIEEMYHDSQVALLSMQNDYDAETKNSQLPDAQSLWNKKIDEQVSAISKQ